MFSIWGDSRLTLAPEKLSSEDMEQDPSAKSNWLDAAVGRLPPGNLGLATESVARHQRSIIQYLLFAIFVIQVAHFIVEVSR